MSSRPHDQATANVASGSSTPQSSMGSPAQRRQKCSVAELSQALFDFVVQLLPTAEELAVKEDVRKLLERLIRTIEPDSRLLSFGSTANGFSLRNSDMDLCCIFDTEERMSASNLVTLVGDLLVRETKFHVKPLPHARIPIVKLSLDPSPGLPHGIACDIGFENRLAIENTRLLLCYSLIDPTRVRTLVLFLKVWSKRRKVNSPYKGTLSSYGYVLLVIYFLVHVKNPPVLPNLQQIPPLHPTQSDEFTLNGHNTWFFDDIDVLRQRWQSSNTESVAELLIDFFRFYSREFTYNSGVISIRAGLLKKDTKGWQNDNDPRFKDPRERNRLCIEDPFELDYNVARCVTKDGLYLIRGEFMRASRVLAARPERAYLALAELCEERKEVEEFTASGLFIPPRLSFPPQIPYTIGSSSYRPNGSAQRDRLSPPRPQTNIVPTTAPAAVPSNEPPVHMAPKRSKWTSPPPEEAPDADRSLYESRLGLGLTLATTSSDAREREREHAYLSSSSCSEVMSDDGETSDIAPEEDDVRSVRSFAGEPSVPQFMFTQRAPFGPHRLSDVAPPVYGFPAQYYARGRAVDDSTPTPSHNHRGRKAARMSTEFVQALPPVSYPRFGLEKRFSMGNKGDISRRSVSGTSRQSISNRSSLSPLIPTPQHVPLPPSPVTGSPIQYMPPSPVIVYETSPRSHLGSRPTSLYSAPHSPLMTGIAYPPQSHLSPDLSDLPMQLSGSKRTSPIERRPSKLGNLSTNPSRPMHSHTLSNSTIIAPITPSANSSFQTATVPSQQSSPSCSPLRTALPLLRPSLPPSLGRRPSLGQGISPVATSSLGTPSPSSSNSSRSCSAGSSSPVSSISPQTAPSSVSPNTIQHSESNRSEQFERLRLGHETRSPGHLSRQTSPTSPTPSTGQHRLLVNEPYQEEVDIVRRTELVTLDRE
ncbi:hypothetical protein SCHPADRAFT_900292 [Schizopora paradoxa]|uniref:polynucleotide adenylyltransferase n=1 Tax=Schizopora paradoxa TaxID=27342 RepID=A0A0H2SKW9_9AGAM|nr:hypothetical protein SCHPADRAFT_900292 [Schizopora paradoxa]